MSKTMTLEQALAKLSDVSERLHSVAENTSGDFRREMHKQCVEFDDARGVIAAHLAERDQVVDVGAIGEVITDLEEASHNGGGYSHQDILDGWADKLTRAISAPNKEGA